MDWDKDKNNCGNAAGLTYHTATISSEHRLGLYFNSSCSSSTLHQVDNILNPNI